MIGLGVGRIGCFLNGCCYGTECNLPWAVSYPYYSNAYVEQYDRKEIQPPQELLYSVPDRPQTFLKPPETAKTEGYQAVMAAAKSRPVHPAQLYSTFTALLLAAILVAFYSLPHVPGHVFALMCLLEGATRFLLEMLRVEPAVGGTPLSLSMWIGIGLVIVGAALWFAFSRVGGVNQGGQLVTPAAA
jgi:phosphatidylglycerol:prolipoprotein diacylglycerol transferase